MDYEVFLLSRMREEYQRTGDNSSAVAGGLASTARVITAAAAIMVTLFLSFVLGDERIIKMIGLGLAVAVLVDATLVRMLLVPATMELLARANWWLPQWLDRAIPTLRIEAEPALDGSSVGVSLGDAGGAAGNGCGVRTGAPLSLASAPPPDGFRQSHGPSSRRHDGSASGSTDAAPGVPVGLQLTQAVLSASAEIIPRIRRMSSKPHRNPGGTGVTSTRSWHHNWHTSS